MAYVMPIHRVNPIPYAVGIDPDIDKSGLSVFSRGNKRINLIETVTFAQWIDRMMRIKKGDADFYIDAGWLNKGYHHYENFPPEFDEWKAASKYAYCVKRGIDVGRNFGVGQTMVAFLVAHHGIERVHEVQPLTAKWDAADLKRYTGWVKRTNQDGRDACKQCFER